MSLLLDFQGAFMMQEFSEAQQLFEMLKEVRS